MLCVGRARGEDPKDPIESSNKVFLDSQAKLVEREVALEQAIAGARNRQKPAHAKAFRPALVQLLGDLKAKKAEPSFAKFLALAFKGLSVFDPPDNDLAVLLRPYLAADCPDPLRVEATRYLAPFGTAGMTKDLLAIVEDFSKPGPPPPPDADADDLPVAPKHKESLLRHVTSVAVSDQTPTPDALAILAAVVKQTTFASARRDACRELGDFADKKR